MKKQIFGLLKGIIITVAVLAALYFLLKIDAIDRGLTKFFGPADVTASGGLAGPDGSGEARIISGKDSEIRIKIEGYEGPLDDSEAPYVYGKNGSLFVMKGGMALDITPPDVAPSCFDRDSGITEKLRMRSNACVSSDKTKLLYVINMQNVPVLFLADLVNGGSVRVSENTDTFLFLQDNTVIYATGYSLASELYAYYDGTYERLDSNIMAYPLKSGRGMLWLKDTGEFKFYDAFSKTTKVLCEKVTAFSETVFDNGYDRIRAFCVTEGGKMSVDYTSSVDRTVINVTSEFPSRAYVALDGTGYFFYPKSGVLNVLRGDTETRLYDKLGDMVSVMCFNPVTHEMIAANNRGIYILRPEAEPYSPESDMIVTFEKEFKKYKKNADLIRNRLCVFTEDWENFYISSLSKSSIVWNASNASSWMNKFSSYLYGLTHVRRETVTGDRSEDLSKSFRWTLKALDVPASRGPGKIYFTETLQYYTSVFSDGSIRSVSVLSGDSVVFRDILYSEGLSRGQKSISVCMVSDAMYITTKDRGYSESFCSYILPDGSGLDTLKIKAITSFGEIFNMEQEA